MHKKLKSSEWILFASALLLVSSLYIISKATSFRSVDQMKQTLEVQPIAKIAITITGCVQKPGIYEIPIGSTKRLLLRKSHPKPFADLSNFSLDEILCESGQIDIPALKEILITVEGCVEEKLSLKLEPGSRICDLKGKVKLLPEADKSFFKRKRLLKNGELIKIPRIEKVGVNGCK